MKYIIIELEGPNKPIMFNQSSLENYCVDTFFKDFLANESPSPRHEQQFEIFNSTLVNPVDLDSPGPNKSD